MANNRKATRRHQKKKQTKKRASKTNKTHQKDNKLYTKSYTKRIKNYFEDSFNIILLKDKSYSNVFKNNKGLHNYFISLVFFTYLSIIIIINTNLSGLIGFTIAAFNYSIRINQIFLLIISPLIIFLFDFIYGYFSYLFGILFNIKIKKDIRFLNFFKVIAYTTPILYFYTILFV